MSQRIFEIAFELGGRITPQMQQAFSDAQGMLNNFEGSSNKANKAMKVMKGGALVAGAAIAGITTALTAAVTKANEFSDSIAQLQASTGASNKEIANMKKIMTDLYNNNLGEDWNDLADAVSKTENVTGLAGNELKKATENALVFRDVFGEEIEGSLKATDTMMKNFGITSTQAYNLLAQGAQNGLNKSDELIDSANEYAPSFSSLGISANGMFDLFSKGLESGAFNLDKVGDAVKEFNIRAKDGSKSSSEAFGALGMDASKMTETFAKGGPGASKAFTAVTQAIGKIKDPVEQSAIAVKLFGTQAEDLEMNVITSLGSIDSKFDMTKKTMESVKDIKYDTMGAALQGIGRQIETGILIPIGQKLLPHLTSFSQWVGTNIPIITSMFSTGFGKISSLLGGIGTKIQGLLSGLNLTGLSASFQSYLSIFKAIFSGLVTVVQALIPIIMPILTNVATFIVSIVKRAMAFWQTEGPAIVAAVQNVFGGIAAIIRFISPVILFIINSVWGSIKGVINGALNVIMGVIKIFSGLFTGNFSKMWEGIKQLFYGAVQLIWNLITVTFYGKILGGFKALGTGALSVVRGMWATVKLLFASGVATARNKVNQIVPNIINAFNSARNSATGIAKSMFERVSGWFNKIVDGAKALPGKIGNGIGAMAGKAVSGVKKMAQKMTDNIGTMVNGVIGGINWSLTKLGVDTKLAKWDVPQYAKGTNSHPGGPAILGDGGGSELFKTPSGFVGLSAATDTMYNLPKGTEVINASDTAKVLQSVPKYNKGSGLLDGVKSGAEWVGNKTVDAANWTKEKTSAAAGYVSDKASELWDLASDPSAMFSMIAKKFGVAASGTGVRLELAKAGLSNIKGAAINYLKDKLSGISGGGKLGELGQRVSVRGKVSNSYGIYDGLYKIAQNIMSSRLGSGLVITSGQRNGDPHDHGKHNAVDLSGFGSNGGYLEVAKWASRLPGVGYAIGDNTVFGRKYGDGSKPGWATGHMNHVHVSGYARGGRVTGDGPIFAHEKGGEFIDAPIGSRVTTHSNSKQWLQRLVDFGRGNSGEQGKSTKQSATTHVTVAPVYNFGNVDNPTEIKNLLSSANNDLKALILQVLKENENDQLAVSFD